MPRHRAETAVPPPSMAARPLIRRSTVVSTVAVAATGVAVSSGVAISGSHATNDRSAVTASVPSASADHARVRARAALSAALAGRADRSAPVSRSVKRAPVDATKKRALDQGSGGQVSATEDLTTGAPRDIARAMLPSFGFGSDQFSCLDSLWTKESGWNIHADNPSSSAYGIPQSLPGGKMASAGPDWPDNAATQIRWGLGYIKSRYGTPCGAWGHSQSHNWY